MQFFYLKPSDDLSFLIIKPTDWPEPSQHLQPPLVCEDMALSP